MNMFRTLPIVILLIFVMGCGLSITGDSDESTSSTSNTNKTQYSEDPEHDNRRGNDHEKAIEEIRQDIHHIFERLNELHMRMDEMGHGMQDMRPMPNMMPPMGNVGNPQMNRPNNVRNPQMNQPNNREKRLRGNNPNNNEMTMKQRYDKGIDAYKGKKYKEVISLFSGIINGTDFDASEFGYTSRKAYLYRGLAYYEQQEYIEALEDLTTYIDSKPTEDICLSEAHKGRSLVYLSTGKETEATDDFTKATALSGGLTKNPCLLY